MTQKSVFQPVPPELDFPKYEQAILKKWKEGKIFEKSLELGDADVPRYVFYEGPPTANGLPHNGHVLTRVMKDLFPRYHAMRGERVLRKGGWDTHGLPVEVEVEKDLRIHGKAAIESYGVKPFVNRCIDSVFRYTEEWERLTERLAFWVSLDDAYVTYHKSYVESVWWALSQLFEKGLLYQGHKVVWWWPQGGTALSAAEVGLGYKTVDDPSVFAVFPLVDEPDTGLAIWTTTPWTLPSNSYAAVNHKYDYDIVVIGDVLEGAKPKYEAPTVKRLIVASERRVALEKSMGRELRVERTVKGQDLVGKRYVPPFDFYHKQHGDLQVECRDGSRAHAWWRILAEDFVTLGTGTGIVHLAPAFGEDDHKAHRAQLANYVDPELVELLCAIHPDGTFTEVAGDYEGRWVKEADKDLIRELATTGHLLASELYRHEYPFCWRADSDPLIQIARPAWFIRTTAEIEGVLANNQSVNWLPEHIKDGRFGDFLNNNVDWALSRERYWGTPLNVWECSVDEEHRHAPGSVEAIEKLNPDAFSHWHAAKTAQPELNEHLMVHKPWIDEVVFPCPDCGAEMRRVTEVIDCWFDSGCMPFAQWGFPHQPGSLEKFDEAFPADFISEAIDQTRGWFYSLMMVSSLVFDSKTQEKLGLSQMREHPYPYKTCIVLGHVCDKEGKKESKSRGNYTPPGIILDEVSMEFGVLAEAPGVEAKAGVAWIARADLEGMDLKDGATVSVYRRGESERLALKVQAHKKLPRRVVVIPDSDIDSLGAEVVETGIDTRPVDVPQCPPKQRITLEDPATPAPGADAFRWFFYASSPPWNNTRHSLRNVRLAQKDFQVKLRNVYSFFCIYANIDGWSPADESHRGGPVEARNELDRWLLSELMLTTRKVRADLDEYQSYDAALRLIEFAEGLSNWYVRRSRTRFWASGFEQDKRDAYATLYEALTTICTLTAPFLPFFGEEMYQNLVVGAGAPSAKESVHFESFPDVRTQLIDEKLATEMAAVREIVSLGLRVRTANRLKVRQPLGRTDIVFNDEELMARVESYKPLIAEELNVHELVFIAREHTGGAVSFRLKPNFRALGPRLGKGVQGVKKALAKADGAALYAEYAKSGSIQLDVDGSVVELSGEEIAVAVEAADGFAAETGGVGVVVLHTTLTESLIDEGLLREVLSRVQACRKDMKLGFADRIRLSLDGSERILRVAGAAESHIKRECLVDLLTVGAELGEQQTLKLGEESLRLSVEAIFAD